MGGVLSYMNPFQTSPPEDEVEIPDIPEVTYRDFVEDKFMELIAKAYTLGTIHVGRSTVMTAIKNGNRGLVFIAGESQYSRNMPVCQLCVDYGIYYHTFSFQKKVQNVIKSNSSVVLVRNHSNYYGLFDLCKTAMEILDDL